MAKINREWHLKHKMPKGPTLKQRIEWHQEHLKHCSCREPTPTIKKLLQAAGKK